MGGKGDGGKRWLVAQFPLVALAAILARVGPKAPEPTVRAARPLGLAAIVAGSAFFAAGIASQGRSLTPLPRPKQGARLVTSGPYRVVRNPIYFGGILSALGNTLWHGHPLGLVGTALLAAFFDAKATAEERWLAERFSEYPAYRRRTSKLLPGLF